MVLVTDVDSSVQVGVQFVSALLAQERGLSLPIGLSDMTTPRTGLRSVPRVYPFNGAATFFGLVLDETTQLGKRPRVQPSSCLPPAGLGRSLDARQILDHDHCAWFDAINDPSTDNVVTIPPKPLNLAAKFLEVSLSRFGAFGLELSFQSKVPSVNALPTPFPVEGSFGCDGRTCDAEVHPDSLAVERNNMVGHSNDDMEEKAFLPIDEVRRVKTNPLGQPLIGTGVATEWHQLPAGDGGNAGYFVRHAIGMVIQPNAYPRHSRTCDVSFLETVGSGSL